MSLHKPDVSPQKVPCSILPHAVGESATHVLKPEAYGGAPRVNGSTCQSRIRRMHPGLHGLNVVCSSNYKMVFMVGSCVTRAIVCSEF